MDYTGFSDKELVALFQGGAGEYYYEIVSRYEKGLYQFIFSFTDSHRETDQVLREVFLKAYRHLDAGEEIANFRVWFFRLAVDTLAHKRGEPIGNSAFLENGVEKIVQEAQLGEGAERTRLFAALKLLPEEYRLVFVLRDVNKFSTKEVADVLNLKSAMVRAQLHRARLMLLKNIRNNSDSTSPNVV